MATKRQRVRINEPKFQLRSKSANTPQLIYLVFRFQNTKLVYSTGHKVHPRYWNFKTERVRNVTDVVDKDDINDSLDTHVFNIKTFYKLLLSEGKPINCEILKERLDGLNEKLEAESSSPKQSTLFQFIDKFIEQSRHRVNPKTGKKLNDSVVNKYENTLRRLKEFKKKSRKCLDFNTIDLDFYQDFMAFLVHEKGYATNTIGRYIKTVKEFLNAATDEGINTNLKYRSSRFKTINEISESIYLSEGELDELYRFNLTNAPRLERIRDLFLIGAWTGLRFSDFSKLSSNNIKGDFIEVKQQKTDDYVMIPIHPVVEAILKKYDGEIPKASTNQVTNKYLKELGEVVGINQTVKKSITKGGKRITTNLEKYKMLTTHTARRSFATNLYLGGFHVVSIMKITGHKTETAFLRYIKVTPKEHAVLLSNHWKNKGLII